MSEPRARKTHELRCWPTFFNYTFHGFKKFELRRNDRDFQVGDHLLLKEWDPDMTLHAGDSTAKRYTGREVLVRVDYIMPAAVLDAMVDRGSYPLGFVIMSTSHVK